MASIDFWFDFASTYSYIAAVRIEPAAQAAGVSVRYRPFLLGPIFRAQGWTDAPANLFPAKGRYMWRDLERLAAPLGITIAKPETFPQNSVLANRVALAARAEAWLPEFVCGVYEAEFGQGKNISDAGVIAEVLEACGIAPAERLERAQSADIKDALRVQTEQAQTLGIFGAPTIVTPDGELFWGNDRLDDAIQWSTAIRP